MSCCFYCNRENFNHMRNDTIYLEAPSKLPQIFLSITLIIVLGFAAYGNSLNNGFIWDDDILVENNEHIKSWSYLAQVFTKDLGAGTGNEFTSYRPIQTATYMMDYSLWKLNPRGFHLTNIVLHIAAALSLYWLINIIFNNNFLSLLTAALFVVHPIHVEAVAYISGRADPLSLLFMLLCFISYIKSPPSKHTGVYILMLLSYALALFSRENSLILPVLVLLYHYSFKKKIMVREFVSIVIIASFYVLLRMTVLKSMLAHAPYTTTALQRLPGFFVAVTTYVKLLFLPFNLHMEYGSAVFHWGNPQAILGVVLLLTLLIYAFRKRKDQKLVFFSVLWFFVALLPVANLYPINSYMAEHWLYLPSIGFFLIIAKAIHSLHKAKAGDFRILVTVLVMGLFIFYTTLTIKQNIYWGNPVSFYKRTLKYAPDSSKLHYNLGNAYGAIGKNKESIAAYKKATEIKPDYLEAYSNLGTIYHAINKNKEAIAAYKKAIAIKPDSAIAYYNLGNAYNTMSKSEEAIAAYKKVIEINPGYANAYTSLGNIYETVNKNEEAIAAYQKAVESNPDAVEIYNRFAKTCIALGKKEEAAVIYRRIIEIDPNYADAYNGLAVIYFDKKQYQLAIEYYDQATKRGFTNRAFMEALKPFRRGNK